MNLSKLPCSVHRIIAFIILLCTASFCRAQQLTITDANLIHNAKVIILSEWHLSDLFPQYKRKLIEKLYQEEGLTDLVLETGKSTAYLLNEYIKSGDDAILNNFPLFTQKDKDYWKQCRNYKRPSGKPIKIHGIDFERMSIVPALKRVLEKTKHTHNELYEYLSTLPDTIQNLYKYDGLIGERNTIIQKCISIYKSDVAYYSSIYDGGFIVKEICENPVNESNWDQRSDGMSHNLHLLYQRKSHKYLLIVGMFHVDCPTPIYKELSDDYKLKEDDIVNIALVVKDCESEAMYQGKEKVKVASSNNILNEPGLTYLLYTFYSMPCVYQMVDVKSKLPNYTPGFKCNYILAIDCKYDDIKCDIHE